MFRYLLDPIKTTPRHEITFKMVSGKTEVYNSSNGELNLYSSLGLAKFSDGKELVILNSNNIESITFTPLN